jgi:hypothetical protein
MKYDIGDVGFEVLTAVFMKSPVFLDTTYSSLKINRRFRGTCRTALVANCFTLISCFACFWALKMEVTLSSETSFKCLPESAKLVIGENSRINHGKNLEMCTSS